MKLICDYIKSIKTYEVFETYLMVELSGVNFYHLYMNNNIDNIIKEIPTEELESYLEKRKKEENQWKEEY